MDEAHKNIILLFVCLFYCNSSLIPDKMLTEHLIFLVLCGNDKQKHLSNIDL